MYDGFGRLLQRYTGPANALALQQFSYDGLGRLLSDTHANGDITIYKYDDASNQTRVTFSNGLTRISTYNKAGELVAVAESAAGKILSLTTNAYDSNGRLRISTDAVGQRTHYLYDPSGRRFAEIDPNGALTEYVYLVNSSTPAQTTRYSSTLSAASLAKLVDANGRPVETILIGGTPFALQLDNAGVRPVSNGSDRREWNVFNDAGQIVRSINADGLVKLYEYDGVGRLQKVTECAIRLSITPYGTSLDVLNKAVPSGSAADRITQYVYDQDNLLRVKRDANGYTTRTTYDTFGNAIVVTDKAGFSTTYFYDKSNNLVLQITAEGNAIRTEYNSFGKPVTITHFDAAVAVASRGWRADATTVPIPANTGSDAVTRLEYDNLDRLTKSIDAEGYIEIFTYDGFGNRIGYQNKLGGLYSYTYDRRGLMLSETLPILSRGQSVINRFEYDARGNRTLTVEASGWYEQRITRFEFDALDRQTRQIGDAVGVTDSEGRVTATLTPIETRSYDARGNLLKTVDAAGNSVNYYYDAADRMTGHVSATGTLTLWTYDAVGKCDLRVRRPGACHS